MQRKRRIHVCPPATATEIRKALRISKSDVAEAKRAIDVALAGKSK